MKITDIITCPIRVVESLEATLSSLTTEMRKGMTISDFVQSMQQALYLHVNVNYRQNPTMDEDEFKSMNATMGANGGKKTLTVHIEGGAKQLDPHAEVGYIEDFIEVFSHEMSHYFQLFGKNPVDAKVLATYDIPADKEDKKAWFRRGGTGVADYYLHAIERPAYLQNVGAELSNYEVKPTEYFDIIRKVLVSSYAVFSKLAKEFSPEEALEQMKDELTYTLDDEHALFRSTRSGAKSIAVNYIMAVLDAKFVTKDAEAGKRVSNKFNSMKRLFLKKFKSVDAYHKKGVDSMFD